MTMGATLLFPAVTPAALDYLRAARARGEAVVCAASVASPEAEAEHGECLRLPSIYEADFAARFLALVRERSVARVFCPVASVHDFMRRFIAERGLELALLGESPIRQQVAAHRALMARADRLAPLLRACADGAAVPDRVELAGVLRQASLIYGESNDEKLVALIAVAGSAPRGDVVEIGSLMGRSAFVLLWLARRYRIGPLFSVDPWSAGAAVQHQSPGEFQRLVEEWDFEALAEGFFVNLAPFGGDDHAHWRLPSADGFAAYASGRPAVARSGAPLAPGGRIALLHIDGNHDHDCVTRDLALWVPRLADGAWLVLDDYVWAHGDGPRRAGDRLLTAAAPAIGCAFVCGKALFVRFDRAPGAG